MGSRARRRLTRRGGWSCGQLLPFLVTDEPHLALVVRMVSTALGATTLGVEAAAVASVEVASNATRRPLLPDLDEHRGSFAYVTSAPVHLSLPTLTCGTWRECAITRAIRQLLQLTAADALRP
jgi:hypothetical protein